MQIKQYIFHPHDLQRVRKMRRNNHVLYILWVKLRSFKYKHLLKWIIYLTEAPHKIVYFIFIYQKQIQ